MGRWMLWWRLQPTKATGAAVAGSLGTLAAFVTDQGGADEGGSDRSRVVACNVVAATAWVDGAPDASVASTIGEGRGGERKQIDAKGGC